VGLLFSSVTLYLTYRPYWYIFHAAILNGDGVQARDLQEFLTSMQALPGVPHRLHVLMVALLYSGSPSFSVLRLGGRDLAGCNRLGPYLPKTLPGPNARGPATAAPPLMAGANSEILFSDAFKTLLSWP